MSNLTQTPASALPDVVEYPFQNAVFDKTFFEGSIQQKGYPTDLYHAYECPCADITTGSALPSCRNCGGTGLTYILAKEDAKVLMHSMDYKAKILNWNEANAGMARATTMDIDKLTYMDKIVLKSVVTDFAQRLRLVETQTEVIAYTIYPIIEVERLFAFVDSQSPLRELIKGTDYELLDNVLKFNTNYKNVTIRYTHNPAYIVAEIIRDVMEAPARNGSPDIHREKMPLHFICRRVNFVTDTDSNGSTLIDNK